MVTAQHAVQHSLGVHQVKAEFGSQHPHDHDTARGRAEHLQRRWSALGKHLLPPFGRQIRTTRSGRESTVGTG
ncbi:hypothetical protein [Streptomyces gilvosporeus]|uniref:hypothetical protein n=1 Tax=Streptomyces gilvosporeus TaxID=553510 RepID=UPI00131C30CD|nr:hypothetical protein [Streptomyces gilvosporeus]